MEESPVTCPKCGVQVKRLQRHLEKVHPTAAVDAAAVSGAPDVPVASATPVAPPAPAARRPRPTADDRLGELWVKCPECRQPVRDAVLFRHLQRCPGAEVRKAQWLARKEAGEVTKPDAPPPEAETEPETEEETELETQTEAELEAKAVP